LYKQKQSIDISADKNKIIFSNGKDQTVVEVHASNILKIHYLPKGEPTSTTEVVKENTVKEVKAEVDKDSNPITIKTDKLVVEIDKRNYGLKVRDVKNNVLLEEKSKKWLFNSDVNLVHAAEDNFYGISGYDAWEDSKAKLLRNTGEVVEAGKQGDAGAPLVWSTKGYGLLVNSITGEFRINKESLKFTNSSKKDTEYYVMLGNPKEIMESVASLSGKAPMFPKWAMGFTNSEWTIDQKELNLTIDKYREKNIPIDNFTLDFDWKAWSEDNYGEFRWNEKKFPDGKSGKLKADMEKKGIVLSGILKPRIHVDTVQGKYAEEHGFWYTAKGIYNDYFSGKKVSDIDFSIPEARTWYFNHLKEAYNTGIVGWWNDEADEGFDSMQHLNMQKALYEGQRAFNSNRVWSINRNFILGAQKYAYGMWSGDIKTGFHSMMMQRERMLSVINLGQTKWGMDTGGFQGNPKPENYTRWMQFSAFTPIFRVHGEKDKQRQPWIYGEKAEAASKEVMQLRYKLIPYIYSYERRAYETGLGLVKPLLYDYPQDKNVENYVDAWMFGDYMLVSPVVEENQDKKTIYLPEGTWIDYFTGKRYSGGKNIEHKVDKETWKDIPLFIKSGAIMPTQDFMNYVGEKPVNNIYVDVFPDKTATSFRYYDDDGKTYDYEKGVYFAQNMTTQDNGTSASFKISGKEGSFISELKSYVVKVHGKEADKVSINGVELKKFSSYEELILSGEEGYTIGKDQYGSVTYVKAASGIAKDIEVTGKTDEQQLN
jgi:alpha-glucosidase